MSGATQLLQRRMASASDLHGIVRSMKALALSNISQFEQAIDALHDYARVIEAGLGVCFRQLGPLNPLFERRVRSGRGRVTCLVFGSDHGLVGQFNDIVAEFAAKQIKAFPEQVQIHSVGERVANRMASLDMPIARLMPVPNAVSSITQLIGNILSEDDEGQPGSPGSELHVIYNQPKHGITYEPVIKQVLPFDDQLRSQWTNIEWPSPVLPQALGDGLRTTSAFLREFIFVALYRACALSLSSENASRLAAMQRADKNIDDLMKELQSQYHGMRQREIDDDLFDVVAGYDATRGKF